MNISDVSITLAEEGELEELFHVADRCYEKVDCLIYKDWPPSIPSSRLLNARRRFNHEESETRVTFKAVLKHTGQIIGGSRWGIYHDDEPVTHSVEEIVEAAIHNRVPEMSPDAIRASVSALVHGKRAVLGTIQTTDDILRLKKRMELETVFVLPRYQGQGLGTDLIKRGIQKADQLGLMTYVEATEDGRPIVRRLGFQEVRYEEFDGSAFGGRSHHRWTFMTRPATPALRPLLPRTDSNLLPRPSSDLLPRNGSDATEEERANRN